MSNNNVTLKEKLKEVFKHSIVYGLTSSLQSVLGFIMLPILTAYYTPDIFGVYSILLLLSALTSAVFYFGASTALGRFYFEEDIDLFRKKIFTTSLTVTIFGASMLIFSSLLFAEKISILLFNTKIYSKPIILILIGTSFGFLLNLMTLLLRYEKKSVQFFVIIISGVVINFSLTYFLLSRNKLGLLAPIYGLLFSNVTCFLILFFSNVQLLTRKLELSYFKMVIKFGIQSSIAGLLFYLLEWVDRLIIKDLLNLTEVGIYSLGYRLGSIMNILVIMPFALVWGPLRMQHAYKKDADVFSGKVVSYYTLIGVLILLFVILFGENIMKLFFVNKSYYSSLTILPIIMFSFLFYGYQSIIDFGIYLHKKVYFYIVVSFIAIIFNVIMNYWLIPKMGYKAAAYITLLTYMLTSTSIYLISNYYFKIQIEVIRVLVALSSVVILYSLINFIPITNFYLKLIIAGVTIYLFYIFWLNEKEKNILYNKFGYPRKLNNK